MINEKGIRDIYSRSLGVKMQLFKRGGGVERYILYEGEAVLGAT